jgi:hypothetical protein
LNQWQFSSLLSEMGSEYEGLPYYAEVHWLSCHYVLKHFWLLHEVFRVFLETKGHSQEKLDDNDWLQDLAFMVDIAGHLSDLNLKLQGKQQVVTSLYDAIEAFKTKL